MIDTSFYGSYLNIMKVFFYYIGKKVGSFDDTQPEEVLDEFKPLAEQGNAIAQFNLGLMYDKGYGVTRDYTLAHMWWNIGASLGYESAKRSQEIIEKEMASTQIETAKKLARECVK